MKDKEKQIEKMAKIIGHCYCDKECQNKCAYCDISSLNEAKKLYENGFRKLSEDSVVLSRQEYDDFLRQGAMIDFLKECHKDIRKKTAEKFAEKLENGIDKLDIILHEDNDEQYVSINQLLEFIDEIAKQFGVEIKES